MIQDGKRDFRYVALMLKSELDSTCKTGIMGKRISVRKTIKFWRVKAGLDKIDDSNPISPAVPSSSSLFKLPTLGPDIRFGAAVRHTRSRAKVFDSFPGVLGTSEKNLQSMGHFFLRNQFLQYIVCYTDKVRFKKSMVNTGNKGVRYMTTRH